MQKYKLNIGYQNMPFYKEIKYQNISVLLWKYHEKDLFNPEDLIEKENLEKVKNYHHKKLSEYLMVRQLKNIQYPKHKILYKKIGQPYLEPQDAYVSVSHSFPFAGLAISKNRVGIDVEKIRPKIQKIQHKFLYSTENEWIMDARRTEYLTVIWAIKEALYKLHPSKYWSLKKHYEVSPFDLENLSEIPCRIFDAEFEDQYIAKVIKVEDYYVAMIQENHQINYQIPK